MFILQLYPFKRNHDFYIDNLKGYFMRRIYTLGHK